MIEFKEKRVFGDPPPDEPKPTVEDAFVNQSTPAPEKPARKGKKVAA